ncbi:MAG: DUF2007 domain-containing protein [Actinobacteria bacterium]|nr:DUF2007 domain-containing protein [Actinomycetota bacterium]
MADMTRVARFSHRVEAELARASLESEGIPALLLADDAGGTWPGLPINLLVEAADVEAAEQILEPMRSRPVPSSFDSAGDDAPPADGLPWWASAGLIMALLVALGMVVLTITH